MGHWKPTLFCLLLSMGIKLVPPQFSHVRRNNLHWSGHQPQPVGCLPARPQTCLITMDLSSDPDSGLTLAVPQQKDVRTQQLRKPPWPGLKSPPVAF